MSVEAFTVDGKVTIDTTPFESGIAKVTNQLSELNGSIKSMMEMGGGNWNFNGALNGLKTLKDDLAVIKEDIATMNTEFANTQGINALKTEIASLRSEIDAIKQKVNETTTQTVQRVREVKTEISAITSGTEPLVQLWTAMNGQMAEHYDILSYQESEIGQINAQWRETQTSINRTKQLMKQIYNETEGWTTELSRVELQAKQIELYFRREQDILKQSLNYLEQEATLLESQKALEDAKLVAEENLNKAIAERVAFYNETLLEEEKEMEMAYRIMGIQEELNGLIGIEAEEVLKIADSEKLVLETIGQQVAMEEERLALMSEITAMQNAQITKVPTATGGKGAKGMMGNDLDKMSYLPRRIGSMALTMWGFNEIMDIYDKSSSNLNARGSQKYFSEALQTDQRYLNQTKQSTVQVRTEMSKLGDQLDALQKKYQKIDMTVVGANAEETAYKYGLQADKIGDLSEVMAIYGSEFVKQGRSQEDSILALNDALDGELRRLKEVNVGKEELEAHGWTGDQASMIDALKQIADERGYTLTAQNITNLNDAIETLELKISRDLVDAFEYIQPILIEVAKDFVIILEAIESLVGYLNEVWKKVSTRLDIMFGVQNMQKFGNISTKVIGGLITGLISLYIIKKVASVFSSGWNTILDALGKTKPIDKASDSLGKLGGSTNTGGTSAPKERGGFKDGIKGLAENLGKMAKVFVEVAVAIAMAWALIEEAILLISAIGYTYDSLKPQFDSGIEFIKEFGLWFALLGGAMLVFSYALGKVPESAMQTVTKGATKLALGMAIAIGLVTEAIGLLIAPMLAIALLGGTASFLGTNLDKGLEVISWIGNALHQIDLPVALFIGGFLAISLLLGLVQPLTLALAVGIASALLLVTEAIVMLIPPLGAIALLGGTASMLGQDKIQQGADALKIVAQALKTIAEAVPYLLAVDIGVLGQELMDLGSKLITGKDGLTYLSENIIPTLSTFVESFNNATINPINETTVANLSQVASQLPTIKSAIDTIRTTIGNGGTGGINVLGFQIGGDTSSLKPKLDILYEDIKAVIDFANKFGNSTDSTNATTGVTQMANAVAQLQAKINLMITTITGASPKVKEASKSLGSAIKVGFNEGSSGFNQTVISVIASGIREVQSRYPTWHSGGEASADKLADGFKNHKPSLKTVTSNEIDYALGELDDAKDDFYNKGKDLGSELTRGYQDGADIHSPGLIARTTARELRYTMDALDVGKQMMYQGGVALGQALTNGYNSYGNLRTDVGVLASKGVSNEQLQANARSVQANANKGKQVPQISSNTINIDMSNSTIIGVQDLDARIRESVEKAIISMNTPNGAIGY